MMIEEKLQHYINNEKETADHIYSIDTVAAILDSLDNPHKKIKTIHIAGTNGKSSVAYMLYYILLESGYSPGLYTSPHLITLHERIKVNGKNISDEQLLSYLERIESVIKENTPPSYFDILTAIAFLYFYDCNVDVAIIETGLGGRLDSTNVITPVISIITNIAMDHKQVLGNTLSAITKEKAGIIKKNVPLLTSNQKKEVLHILTENALRNESPFYVIGKDYLVSNMRWESSGVSYDYNSKFTSLKTIHVNSQAVYQAENSATAIAALEIVRDEFEHVTPEACYAGLQKSYVPGRFELINQEPLIIYDPAHNLNAMEIVINQINSLYGNKHITICLSLMKDKEVQDILRYLNKLKFSLIYIVLNDQRCYIPSEKEKNIVSVVKEHNKLLKEILKRSQKDSLFLFTGTFRLYEKVNQLREISTPAGFRANT